MLEIWHRPAELAMSADARASALEALVRFVSQVMPSEPYGRLLPSAKCPDLGPPLARALRLAVETDCDGSEIEQSIRSCLFDYLDVPELRDLPITVLHRILSFDDALSSDHAHQLFEFCVDIFRHSGPCATILFLGLDAGRLTETEIRTLQRLTGLVWDRLAPAAENWLKVIPGRDPVPGPSREEEAANARLLELQEQIARNELYLRAQEAALFL
jgi:hypothetical protein